MSDKMFQNGEQIPRVFLTFYALGNVLFRVPYLYNISRGIKIRANLRWAKLKLSEN